MGLPANKRAELVSKLASVEGEFGHWLAASEPGEALEKHHSQIRRITAQLRHLAGLLRAEVEQRTGDDVGLLASFREFERAVLELHRIWEYFRGKLAQRWVGWLAPYLKVADEFAWDCYGYAQRTVKPEHRDPAGFREPPLVFLNGGSSPFTMSRDFAYRAETVPGEKLDRAEFRQVLGALPIPVIGVPWFQVHHLPEALVIGHEVGHNVEDDFGLAPWLEAALAAADLPASRRAAWQSWRGEIFADTYGVLAGGPAFVGALMDFLASDVAFVTTDRQPRAGRWDIYPTDALRIGLALALLQECGFAAEAQTLGTRWRSTYPSHAMTDFEDDLGPVARALLKGPYPVAGGNLEGFRWRRSQEDAAREDADNVMNGYALSSDDVRSLLVVARLAFENDPRRYEAENVPEKILERALATIAVGTRAGGFEDLAEADRVGADEAVAVALFDRLR